MRRVACLAMWLAAVPAVAQRAAKSTEPVVQIPRAAAQGFAQASQYGQRSRIFDEPPTFTLTPSSAEAHKGTVWVRAADNGLLILVKVDTPAQGFRWPEQKSDLLGSDHVEVWLAGAAEVPMPPVGWGNQFGESTLKNASDCNQQAEGALSTSPDADNVQHCRRWFAEQVRYREQLRRLFVRQWLIAGRGGLISGQFQRHDPIEAFASAAWTDLTANFFPEFLPTALKPKQDDGVISLLNDTVVRRTPERSGYEVQMLVPYSAFPPVQQTDVKDLYLAVDVYSAAPEGKRMGAVSSTAAGHAWGRPETFNHVQLTNPQHYAMGACDARPAVTDMYGKNHGAWFYPVDPTKSDVVDSVIALINPAAGYMYDPGGVSPEAQTTKYFWKTLPDAAVVCGPQLAYRKGSVAGRTNDAIQEKYLDARSLPDGWTLVRNGPVLGTHSAFGSGQCGACPEAGFDIYAISPAGKITPALQIDQDLSGEPGVPDSADLSISADWSRVTLFRNLTEDASDKPTDSPAAEKWEAVDYCFQAKPSATANVVGATDHVAQTSHTYKECGTRKDVKPPTPPHYPEMSDPDGNH